MAHALPRSGVPGGRGTVSLDTADPEGGARLHPGGLRCAASRGRDLHLGCAAAGAAAERPCGCNRPGDELGARGASPMTAASQSVVSPKTLLRLGRVSNLPTVWTNVLAATVLAGGAPQSTRTAVVLIAMSLFYVGGMYLNDYFDREIDARERPE